jgi:hypothetical protein
MYMIMTDRGWRPFHALNKPCANSNSLEGVYRPETIERSRGLLAKRFERWAADMQYEETRKNKFSGDRYNEPLFGAFGEKL